MKKTILFPVVIVVMVVFLMGFLAAVRLYFFTGRDLKENTVRQQVASRTFTFPNIQLSIDVPEEYEIDDRSISIFLRSSGGEILVSRNATNFDTLEEYLNDVEKKTLLMYWEKVIY